jgi:hypothetical protein
MPGAAFTKCFYNSSTIIPFSTLPQANPYAPNSSKRGQIVEELWKNCRKILRVLVRQATGKNPGRILRLVERAQNFSTIFLQFFHNSFPLTAGRGPAKSFYNSSTILC